MAEYDCSQYDILQRVVDIRSSKSRIDIEYEVYRSGMSAYVSALTSALKWGDPEYGQYLVNEVTARKLASNLVGPEHFDLN